MMVLGVRIGLTCAKPFFIYTSESGLQPDENPQGLEDLEGLSLEKSDKHLNLAIEPKWLPVPVR